MAASGAPATMPVRSGRRRSISVFSWMGVSHPAHGVRRMARVSVVAREARYTAPATTAATANDTTASSNSPTHSSGDRLDVFEHLVGSEDCTALKCESRHQSMTTSDVGRSFAVFGRIRLLRSERRGMGQVEGGS